MLQPCSGPGQPVLMPGSSRLEPRLAQRPCGQCPLLSVQSSSPHPRQPSPPTTAIYPWLTARKAGTVDLVFHGAPAAANYQTCEQTGGHTRQDEALSARRVSGLDGPVENFITLRRVSRRALR
jgi:hypothetical protein